MKKNKKEISSIFLTVFFVFIIILAFSTYLLKNYYFIDASVEFENNDNNILTTKKIKSLKRFDFSVFEGETYAGLEKGYWYKINNDLLTVGNKKPFESVPFVENREVQKKTN